MRHATCAVIGPEAWAASLGKKTTETAFAIHSLKAGDAIVSILHPSKYPEKLQSLLFSLYLADHVYLNVESVDKVLGEVLVTLGLMDKRKGSVSLGQLVDADLFAKVSAGNPAGGFAEFPREAALLREEIARLPQPDASGGTRVLVDQAFFVKGVGTVALGFVTSGVVERHQQLVTVPGGKRTEVRSIQLHDEDHEEAPVGARVGLALKNIGHEDLPRGTCLSPEGSSVVGVSELDMRMSISPLWKQDIAPGMHLHTWTSLSLVPAVLTSFERDGDTAHVRAELESKVWLAPGELAGLAYLDSKSFRLFAAGRV